MRCLYVFFFMIVSLLSVAQTGQRGGKGYIEGSVYEEKTKESIVSATVKLLNTTDSATLQAVATNDKGHFKFWVESGKYIIEVSFIGYKTFSQEIELTTKQPNFTLSDILLQEGTIMLEAAVVEGKVPDIVVKGDTIEYNASSYSSQESDMLQDMVKNIPGIEVDENGNITANGKPIRKILVDGKEFFGNDIPMALANLPANMIKKLQLYKEESETAKVTGFRDKDPEQVLNLVVKEELKQSTFGDIRAGYGSDDKYAHKALVNYMRNDNQVSFVGDMSNIPDNEYSMGMDNGIDKDKNIGVNAYIQTSEKLKVGGNVRYSDNENLMETQTNTQTFLSTGDRLSKQNMSSNNKRSNTNFGVNIQWKPDSLTTVFARSYISLNDTKSEQRSTNLSYVAEKDTTSGYSTNQSKGDDYSINNFFTIGRTLNKNGRTVSMSFNNSIRNENSKGSNYSYTSYTGKTADKIIDQRTNTDNKTSSYNLFMSYVEPLGKDYRLQLSYSYGINNSERIRDVRKIDDNKDYTIIDTAYARNTENKYINQNVSLNFQATKEKYRYTIGFSIDPSRSRSKISLGDSIIENLSQSVVNFSPTLNFSYTPKENTSVDFNYSGSTSQPGISQLSADTVILNALSKYYGNPNLKPSYSNNFNLYYQKSDYETSRFFMLMGGFNYIFNNIVDYTIIDDQGNSTNTYRNVSGNMGANINFMYNTPLRNKKFTIANTSVVNYYKNIGFTNGEKAITHNIVLNEQVMARFKNDKFESLLRAGISYNMTRNNLTDLQDRNTTNYTLNHFLTWKLPYDFTLTSNINYSYYVGYGDDFKSSEVLWNTSVSKQFLKKKKGTVKVQMFDILNDRNNISRYVSGNYMSDSRSNTVNQYFLVSFSYKFNVIKGKKDNDESDIYEGEL
ncbi:TonB-dependent receptor [Dysgonomonas sp. Marseille-P4677]|uniref:TonB-dependent receptor n=1 Tax=Dysgonomonas sp. Marseille-P4677 TaxID=2364790 RepID=UPI001913C5C2|nr:TonB-dependent receptor [Dysgonomonas sp. Marseille-P4677]MBK5722470.1 TonB-dependent receptor [Dysgonomonas sp. Marseille-P4677]